MSNLPPIFRMAKKAIRYSTSKYRLGSCILVNRKVVSIGFNQMLRTHPLVRKYDEFKAIHAEVSAILRLKNKDLLNGSTLVVYRETKNGTQELAKPCEVCQRIMKDFGISEVYYSTPDGYEVMKL